MYSFLLPHPTIKNTMKNFLLLIITALTFGVSSFTFQHENPYTLSGTVTDVHTGSPLIGATVLVVGTSVGTVTDVDGKIHPGNSKKMCPT
jgi:iron complex outermembrane receptor protein